jgi:hypothetical protein
VADENLVHSVELPEGAEPPIRVYVNGAERQEGVDFALEGGTIRFLRPLRAQPRLGLGRKVMLAIGIGVYGDLRGDTLDVRFTRGGRTEMTSIRLESS